jgi:hypothetical protein
MTARVLARSFLFAVAGIAIVASPAGGQFPGKISYQVMLTDDLGNPLADQPVQPVFRPLDESEVQQWTEPHDYTTNSIGVVTVTLGATNGLSSVDFSEPLWLEVEVDGETLSPLRELISSPTAFYAADAAMLGGLTAAEFASETNDHHERYYPTEDLATSDGREPNVGTNMVSRDNLNDVPADLIDGDDVGGTGDGHSLDASDGSPTDVVYVEGDGTVTVGQTETPTLKIASTGAYEADLWLFRAGEGRYDYRLINDYGTLRFQLSQDDGSIWQHVQHFGHDGSLGLGRDVTLRTHMLDVAGDAGVAGRLVLGEDGLADGSLELYRNGTASPTLVIDDDINRGGRIRIRRRRQPHVQALSMLGA